MKYSFRMKQGKKSRYKPQAGDLFCYEILPDRVHFVRVIKADHGPIPDSELVLLYFYAATSTTADRIPELSRTDLLVPPLIAGRECLLHGYFQHIANQPLLDGDVLPIHCFHCSFTNRYFDEESREIWHRTEPCGTVEWATLVGIDRQLSEALGLPPDEDTEDDDSYNNDDVYHIWPSDRINDKVVTLQIRIPEMADPGAEGVDRGAIEEHIESQLKDGKLAEWYASGTYFLKYSHIDYDIHPGQFPVVHAIVEKAMKDFGVTQYRILVQE